MIEHSGFCYPNGTSKLEAVLSTSNDAMLKTTVGETTCVAVMITTTVMSRCCNDETCSF